MKNLILVIALILTSGTAHADKVISEEHFETTLFPSSFKCIDGNPSGFGRPLQITYDGTLYYFQTNEFVWSNSKTFIYVGSPTDHCSEFADILKQKNGFKVKGTKTNYQSISQNSNRGCNLTITEEVTLDLGRIQLTGRSEFLISPSPSGNCNP